MLTKCSLTPAISAHNPDISAQSARRAGSQFHDRWITHPTQDQDLHELISSPHLISSPSAAAEYDLILPLVSLMRKDKRWLGRVQKVFFLLHKSDL